MILDDESPSWRGRPSYGSGLLAAGAGFGWYAVLGHNPSLREDVHRRLFCYRQGQALIVIDQLRASEEQIVERRVHAGAGLNAELTDGRAVALRGDRAGGTVSDWSPVAVELSIIRARRGPRYDAWTFPRDSEEVPVEVICMRSTATDELLLHSVAPAPTQLTGVAVESTPGGFHVTAQIDGVAHGIELGLTAPEIWIRQSEEPSLADQGLVTIAPMASALSTSAYANRDPSAYTRYLQRFEPVQPPLLDLGCGFGLLLALAGQRGIEAVGLELLDDRVNDCRERGLDVRRHDLAERLPLPDESFGMVYCGQVIEHMPEPVKLNVFRDALRVLRPGGQFQVCSPCRHFEQAREHGHDYLLTPSELHALLRQAGWQDIVSLDYPQQVPEVPREVTLDLWRSYHPDLLSQSASAICTKH